jgi:hypothetical protein
VLWRAWLDVRRNGGAAGIDQTTLAMVEEYGVDRLLDEVATERREGRYRPLAAWRVFILKPGNTERRPLSIPTVRDRVVQAALKIVLEPIFEADMADCSFGFRPRRSAHDALQCSSTSLGGADGGWWRPISRTVWMLHHTAPSANCGDQNRPSWGFGGWMRRPFLRPVRTCTAWSSPRLTRCNRVWRDTP